MRYHDIRSSLGIGEARDMKNDHHDVYSGFISRKKGQTVVCYNKNIMAKI